MKQNFKVSKDQKKSAWITLNNNIDLDPNKASLWEKTYGKFLIQKIQTRYFDHIEVINECLNGAGFAIILIQRFLNELVETSLTEDTIIPTNSQVTIFE
tara:strand:+ start:431 stop:727 length:297 start_codon:yes stop_codon:yes gene_type:complete